MATRPEDLYPALSKAYNANDLDAVFYDPQTISSSSLAPSR
jgi:hypothetical protein